MSNFRSAFALTATTLLITACSSDSASDNQVSQEHGNRIILQAEDWSDQSATSTLNWLPVELDNDYGHAAKLTAQDDGQWSSTGLPTLTYSIEFAEVGTYALSVYGRHDSHYAPQPDQNTIITFGSDAGNVEMSINGFNDQWQWISNDAYGQELTIDVNTVGEHLFTIASANTGLTLDRVTINRVIDTAAQTHTGTTTTDTTTQTQPVTQTNNSSTLQPHTSENLAPTVSIAGPLQTTVGQPVTLTATASDDGKPNGTIYYYWNKSSGPGDAIIAGQQLATTEVTFASAGNYSMQVSANDGQLYDNAAITINVVAQATAPVSAPATNKAPVVSPIAPVTAEAGRAVIISANATDDGLPHGGIYYYWSKLSGPGNVTFAQNNTATTQATFASAGTYQLQLNASDGELYRNQQITATVTEGQQIAVIQQPTETHHATGLGNNWKTLNTNGRVTARHEAGGVEVNGKLYVIGGRGKRPVDMYDPATNKWKTVANSPMEMHHFQPVAIGKKIYVIGAFTCCYPVEKIISNIYIFDTQTNKWSKGSKIPANRQRGGAGAAVHNGKIYLLGGNTNGHSGGAVGWFDEYDPRTGKWKKLPSAPDARDHATIAVANNKLVAAAGRESDHPNTFQKTVSRTNVYDFSTGNWSKEANIPTARAGTMTVAHGSEVLVIGGESMASASAHDDVEAYNVNTRKWRKLKSLNTGRHGGAAAFLNGILHVVTGSERRAAGRESTSHEALK